MSRAAPASSDCPFPLAYANDRMPNASDLEQLIGVSDIFSAPPPILLILLGESTTLSGSRNILQNRLVYREDVGEKDRKAHLHLQKCAGQ